MTDPGTDTVSDYIVHWGDGHTDSYITDGNKTHNYADGHNTNSITVDLMDEDGTHLDRANALSVTVNNVAPVVTLTGANTANEGDTVSYSYTTVDPGQRSSPATPRPATAAR